MLEGGNCHNTDISTAADARAALQDFFTAKFPELSSSPLYITGESYAGVYIPTLADEVLRNAPEIVLKGIAVGDPCTDTPAQSEGFDMLWYSHKHGFVPDDDFAFLSQNCSYDAQKTFLSRGYWKRENGQWATPPTHRLSREMRSNKALADACELAERKFLMTTSKGLSQGWDGAYINELDLFTDAAALDWTLPGTLNFYNAEWMNRDDVKEALHVTDAPVDSWPGPSDGWTYTSNWNACNDAPDADSMIQFYQKIAPQLDRTIVFNGDVDPCVTYEGTRNAIQQVGFDVLPGGSYRPWFFNKTATTVPLLEEKPSLFGVDLELGEAGPQFGGHVVNYEHGLTFATIHGAGHMVPQFMPLKGSRLLAQLLMSADDNDNHYPFAPPLPTDEEIAAMSWSEFDAAVDEWTDSAEAFVDSDA
uniref:Carboxypeptidase n=1 Tax=Octactis speculum TaxID=3111310 RepID=A0A7S2FYK5_9STRA